MSDDHQRRARRLARIATYAESEDRHRKAITLPPGEIPTIEQLLAGAALAGGSVAVDATRWAGRLLGSPEGGRLAEDVRAALDRLLSDVSPNSCEDAEIHALGAIRRFEPDITIEDLYGDIADRCAVYGALLGCQDAAGRAVAIAHDAIGSYLHVAGGDPVPLREVVVSLLAFAGLCRRDMPSDAADPALVASWPVVRGNARALMGTIAQVAQPPEELPVGTGRAVPAGRIDEPADVAALAGAVAPGLVVIPAPPAGKKVPGQAGTLVGRRLPLRPLPDLEALGRELTARRPWAAPAIARIVGLLLGRSHTAIPNIVLVGPPGTGKSELARDLATALGVPSLVYACAGAHDGSIGGTSKQWSSARPAVWTQICIENETASGMLILDELDKAAGPGGQNGSVREALLGIAEPSQRRDFWDVGLETRCDLSGISLVATANSTEPLRGPLLDRFVTIPVGAPRREDLPVIVQSVLQGLRAEHADPRWIQDLDGTEYEALRKAWRGGSLRPVKRAVEHIVGLRSSNRFAH
ncbi:AAA family ATPase [Methylobacterium sp. E-065]|uniref:AAA family ATPase n=1 Tax=Methylobacterium sp. E-065 TaxID=2836583 RepID=UPI001FBA755C|nr:AAA family ATPase [Methylobacterium sp. E-065]MCJ2018922.1 AAA family ATPase [Methylobacterium sp. E-065]